MVSRHSPNAHECRSSDDKQREGTSEAPVRIRLILSCVVAIFCSLVLLCCKKRRRGKANRVDNGAHQPIEEDPECRQGILQKSAAFFSNIWPKEDIESLLSIYDEEAVFFNKSGELSNAVKAVF